MVALYHRLVVSYNTHTHTCIAAHTDASQILLPITKCVTRAFPETGAVIGCIGALLPCVTSHSFNLSMALEAVLGVGISTGLANTGFENHTHFFVGNQPMGSLYRSGDKTRSYSRR